MRKEMKGQRDDINGLGPQTVICMFLHFRFFGCTSMTLLWGCFVQHLCQRST